MYTFCSMIDIDKNSPSVLLDDSASLLDILGGARIFLLTIPLDLHPGLNPTQINAVFNRTAVDSSALSSLISTAPTAR